MTTALSTIRQELLAEIPNIRIVRDCLRGGRYIRAQGERYLPSSSGMDEEAYQTYLTRAYFLGATSSTVKGFQSSVFRKPITIKAGNEDDLMNVDGMGSSVEAFSRKVFKEVLVSGRAVVWVAMFNGQYYLVLNRSEQLINWSSGLWGVLQEVHRVGKKFSDERQDRYRTIEYANGMYNVKVVNSDQGPNQLSSQFPQTNDSYFEGGIDQTWFEPDTTLLESNTLANYSLGPNPYGFPITCITPDGIGFDPSNIPLVDLAEANLDHYRLSADLRHGLHTAPFPVFFAAGFPVEDELKIGGDVAWLTDKQGGTAGVLEYQGHALEHLLSAIDNLESLMVGFGARMLERNKKSSETAEALRVRQAAQEASILGLVQSVSEGVTRAVRMLLWYRHARVFTTSVHLPTDLIETKLTSDELLALVAGWLKGAISDEALEFNLRQGEQLPEHITSETYVAGLQQRREQLNVLLATNQGGML